MAELPKLPEPIVRLHRLRWNELIEKHGFTGAHLKWQESPERRRQAARPKISLAPPPPQLISDRTPRRTSPYEKDGQPVPYETWLQQQMAAWALRESDPNIIDSIGVFETITLAQARFAEVTIDYLNFWATTNGDSDEFRQWSNGIAQSVILEVGELWRKDPWHSEWFERACHKKLDQALLQLTEWWSHRASKLEIQHLEKPRLSLESLLSADGNLSFASTLEEGKRILKTSDSASSEQTGDPVANAERVAVAPQELPVEPASGLDRIKMVDDFLHQWPNEMPATASEASNSARALNPDPGFEFGSAAERSAAIFAYTQHWTCSEAALARKAIVDPADLSKWKKGGLPAESDKKRRIESVLKNNEQPIPAVKKSADL